MTTADALTTRTATVTGPNGSFDLVLHACFVDRQTFGVLVTKADDATVMGSFIPGEESKGYNYLRASSLEFKAAHKECLASINAHLISIGDTGYWDLK